MLRLLRRYTICVIVLIGWLCPIRSFADFSFYNCEVGLQVGGAYYVGECARIFDFNKSDEQKNSFANMREAVGAQLSYNFDQRWSVQMKGQWQRITYTHMGAEESNPNLNVDITAEFNFFRFGRHPYDLRVKPITPFVFLGAGVSLAWKTHPFSTPPTSLYVPLGVGVKWMFAERWQLQAAWQHQVFVYNGDALEGKDSLNDSYELNGNNIMNNDLTSSITIGLVFEFWKKGDLCLHCED